MNISLILANPNPQSFGHQISKTCLNSIKTDQHQLWFHDLYQEQFDPILPSSEIDSPNQQIDPKILQYAQELTKTDLLIIIHPNWWGQPPAILKGWIDRSFRPQMVYNFTEKGPQGLLEIKQVLIFTTQNTPLEIEIKELGNPLDLLWKKCIFNFCGVQNVTRKIFTPVDESKNQQRQEWLDEVQTIIQKHIN